MYDIGGGSIRSPASDLISDLRATGRFEVFEL